MAHTTSHPATSCLEGGEEEWYKRGGRRERGRKGEETRGREKGDSHQLCGYSSIAHHHYPPGTDQPLLEVLERQTQRQ